MAFTWTLERTSLDSTLDGAAAFFLDPRTKNTRMLMVPPKTLVPGAWYEFKLVGSSVANASYTGSSLVRVMTGYSPVTAVIAGKWTCAHQTCRSISVMHG